MPNHTANVNLYIIVFSSSDIISMPATFDQLYARLDALGVNMDAIGQMNLPLNQLEEFCQRIEDLVQAHAEQEGGSPPGKDATMRAAPLQD